MAEAADAYGVRWPTAHTAAIEAADAAAAEPAPTPVLGIDEPRRGPRWAFIVEHNRWVRVYPLITGFVDLDGDGLVIFR